MPPRFTRYQVLVSKGRRNHGEKFDESQLAPQMVRWFNNGMRVKVRNVAGHELEGRVVVTPGQRPEFALDVRGGAVALGLGDVVVACRRSDAGQWRPIR